MEIREPELAGGGWYPASADSCRKEIQQFTRDLTGEPEPEGALHGGIVPHAGWGFSGKVAAGVFHRLSAQKPDTVVIFGMHLGPGYPIYMMTSGKWATPLGVLPIDEELAEAITRQFDVVTESATRHQSDNTIEVNLPFIAHYFPEAAIVPIGAPPSNDSLRLAAEIANAATKQEKKILAIGSTDLTHYGMNYGFTPHGSGKKALEWVKKENDPAVISKMMELDPEGVITEALASHNACCPGAAASAIRTGIDLGANKASRTAYATSADIMPGESFVGYTGIVF